MYSFDKIIGLVGVLALMLIFGWAVERRYEQHQLALIAQQGWGYTHVVNGSNDLGGYIACSKVQDKEYLTIMGERYCFWNK
jgi:hypothetical protein